MIFEINADMHLRNFINIRFANNHANCRNFVFVYIINMFLPKKQCLFVQINLVNKFICTNSNAKLRTKHFGEIRFYCIKMKILFQLPKALLKTTKPNQLHTAPAISFEGL